MLGLANDLCHIEVNELMTVRPMSAEFKHQITDMLFPISLDDPNARR